MEDILEIGKYILPALVFLLTVWLVLKQFFKNREAQMYLKIRAKTQKVTLPSRLQAYERITLFLERMSLDQLLVREFDPAHSAGAFSEHLVKLIRSEYDQICTQQIYVSEDAWSLVKMAKENTIQLIHKASQSIERNSSSMDLSQSLIELITKASASATQVALEGIKAEARKLFL